MSDSGEDWCGYHRNLSEDEDNYVFYYENDDYYDCSLNIIDEYTPMYDKIENKFMKPIKFADLSRVKNVFNESNVNVTNREGVSALMIAILHSSSEVVDYLINDCKADINYLNDNGDNLFHYLSDRGTTKDTYDIFKLLISKNIDINHINKDGDIPLSSLLHYSWRNDNLLIKLYLENGANSKFCDWIQIIKTIKTRKLNMFKLMIENGIDLNYHDKYGTTPRILILTLIEQSNCDGDKSIWYEMLKIIDEKISS